MMSRYAKFGKAMVLDRVYDARNGSPSNLGSREKQLK